MNNNSEMYKHRLLVVDIAKSLCIMEIVALWHMFSYIEPIEPHYSLMYITEGVLACFTFLSGLFNGKKHVSTLSFYKSRLIRFFPLLFLSLLSFYLGGWISLQTFAFSLCGLSCFIGPQPMTLWFFSMIVFLYIVTPLITLRLDINKRKRDFFKFLTRSAIMYAILLGIHLIHPIDERLLYYSPFYIVGIASPFNVIKVITKHKIKIFTISIISIVAFLAVNNTLVVCALIWCCVITALLSLSAIIEGVSCMTLKKLFFIISYASMCAYLFHRQLYSVFKQVVAGGNKNYLTYPEAILMVCFLFVVSYIIQKTYDKIANKLVIRSK